MLFYGIFTVSAMKKMIQKQNRRPWIYLLLAVVILVSYAVYAVFFAKPPVTYEDGGKKKELLEPSISTTSSAPSQDKASKPEESTSYSPPASSDNLGLSAYVTDGNAVIITKLYGYSDGTCTMSLRKATQTVTRSAPILYQSEYSSCAGFSIPVSELSSGQWTVTLDAQSGSTTTSKQILLEVP